MATSQLELWPTPTETEAFASKPRTARAPSAAPRLPTAPPREAPTPEVDPLAALRRQVARMETGGGRAAEEKVSCGAPPLDRLLPGGGLRLGALHEWVEQNEGSGAGWLSLVAAAAGLQGLQGSQSDPGAARRVSAGQMVVIDREGVFCPLAAIAAGISPQRLVIVRPANQADMIWAADQALRNEAVSVVWMRAAVLDDRDARRLQLAAEVGRSLGLLVRPRSALGQPSWAEVRLAVRGLAHPEGQTRFLEVRLVRCRGGQSGTSMILAIDSAGRISDASSHRKTAAVPLVAQLAHPKVARLERRRRA